MATEINSRTITAEQRERWERDGYLIERGLFGPDKLGELSDALQALHDRARVVGGIPGCFKLGTSEEIAADPLKLYPRMMHPHRVSAVAKRAMLHPKVGAILRDLFGEEPLAAQSMFYWKPPKARGQALHQDNFYLRVKPGTCIAAWVSLDIADEGNGCLVVVPGSQNLDVVCPETADPATSFTKDLVRVPPGLREVPVIMRPGDCLFFPGSIIHGSHPNRSATRFRRSFICHYVGTSADELARFYKPLYTFADEPVTSIAEATGGGPCGVEAQGPH